MFFLSTFASDITSLQDISSIAYEITTSNNESKQNMDEANPVLYVW